MENDLNRNRYINAKKQFQNKIEELNEKCSYKNDPIYKLALYIELVFENDDEDFFLHRLDFDIPHDVYHEIKSKLDELMIVHAEKVKSAAPAAG